MHKIAIFINFSRNHAHALGVKGLNQYYANLARIWYSLLDSPSEMCKISLYITCPMWTNSVFFFFHQWTPLHIAAGEGHCEDMLQYLVDKGADVNIKDNDGVNVM